MDDPKASVSDIESIRARADHCFRRTVTTWGIVSAVCLTTVSISISLVWGDRDSTFGLWLDRTFNPIIKRASPGGHFGAQAVVHDDGSYDFYPEGEWLIESEYPEQYSMDVSIFVNFRSRAHGWFGRTRYTRPLNFHFSAWTLEGTPVSVSKPLRERLSEEVVTYICQPILPIDLTNDCPYTEILEFGKHQSRGNPTANSQYEYYSIERVRISGYLHNLITLIALGLLLHGLIQLIRASNQRRRWIELVMNGTCPGCGYDTRKLPQLRCPECGTSLLLRDRLR